MIHRVLRVLDWIVDFVFVTRKYDEEAILSFLYTLDASYDIMRRVNKIMESGKPNKAFTYTNSNLRRAFVMIGPTTSGAEFLNSFSHEMDHLADAIALSLGVKEDKEGTSYLTGDTTMALAEVICELGCDKCRESHD